MKDKDVKFMFLGQSILRYKTPTNILNEINELYEKYIKKKKLPSWETHLIGKIKNEHSLFWNSKHETKHKRHNFLSENVLNFFKDRVKQYLEWNKIKDAQFKLNSIWVNEMKAGEYNPIHVHQGDLFTGLSSVMILKLPKSYGKEWSRKDRPTNGQLGFLSNGAGQFYKTDYGPNNLKPGDFFVFPYDIRHYVNPFQGKEKRRTLSMNADVLYDPILNNSL